MIAFVKLAHACVNEEGFIDNICSEIPKVMLNRLWR